MRLRALAIGDRVRVTGYERAEPAYRARLLAMGLTTGTEVRLVEVAPLGDPVKIVVRGYNLSLRKSDADALRVERV